MDKKIRVAITHGDTNGIGYEVILRAFEDPMMLDMCIPIIYGSPKAATFHRKAMQIETQFTIIKNAEEAKDGRVNLLATFDEDEVYDQTDSAGFINLFGLPIKAQAMSAQAYKLDDKE